MVESIDHPASLYMVAAVVAVLNFRKRFVDLLIGGRRTARDHATRQFKYERVG